MPSSAVCDASVVVRWLIDDPLSDAAVEVRRRHDLFAPLLVLSETANALRNLVKAGRLPLDLARRHLEGIPGQMELVDETVLTPLALRLAVERDHAVYDCVYAATALTRAIPLVTADIKLARKFAGMPGLEIRTLQDGIA